MMRRVFWSHSYRYRSKCFALTPPAEAAAASVLGFGVTNSSRPASISTLFPRVWRAT
jgi:hypothetical protein